MGIFAGGVVLATTTSSAGAEGGCGAGLVCEGKPWCAKGSHELGPWDQGMFLPERSLTKTLRRVYAIFQGRGDSCPLNHTRGHMAGHSPSQGCHPGLYHWRGIEKSSDRAEGVAWWFMSCHV